MKRSQILKSPLKLSKLRLTSSICIARPSSTRRTFSATSHLESKSRIFDPIRDFATLQTHLLLSASARTPLITLWTASWCSSCRVVKPIIREVAESLELSGSNSEASGDNSSNGVMFAEVEIDSPIGGVEMGGRYAITSIPTLLSFSRQEAQFQTQIIDPNLMKDKKFLRDWMEKEAKRAMFDEFTY